jgi:hypothetical protein
MYSMRVRMSDDYVTIMRRVESCGAMDVRVLCSFFVLVFLLKNILGPGSTQI